MVPLRKFEKGDWAKKKDRFPTNSPALSRYIKEKQHAFFELQNRYLHKNGITAHITHKNGKWTVVDVTGATASTALSAHAVLFAQRGDVLTSQPVAKPSHAPGLGGSNETQAPRQMLGRYAQLTHHNNLINPNTKGWPPAAIADWSAWGHKEPTRFFRKWPELSSGNPSPTGGRSL